MTKPTDVSKQLLEEVQMTNYLLGEQNKMLEVLASQVEVSKSQDWKLWVLTNAVVDALLKSNLLENDPRISDS